MTDINMPQLAQVNETIYIRVPDAIRRFGISRAKLYQLIKARKFRTVSLAEPGQSRGTRLIDYSSLCGFLNSLDERETGEG